MTLRSAKTASERRSLLESELGTTLPVIGGSLAEAEETVRIENLVGATTIPLGVAGPVYIEGDAIRGKHYIPLATTEGALVASVSRGCKAICAGGGARTAVDSAGMTRGPVFATGSLSESRRLEKWLFANEDKLREAAEKTSSYIRYRSILVRATASYVFVRFVFDTGEAMGMNMATIAAQKAVECIEQETGFACSAVAGNFDVDKKPAWLNIVAGRGKSVRAEALIPKEIVQSVLKTSAAAIFDTWMAKCVHGSYLSGSMGFNCHFANVVAALYIATGQDPAHVVEGSAGITTVRLIHEDLYIAVFLPAILTASVGGGTRYAAQQEALRIAGSPSAAGLAELTGAAVLAGELSLLASLSVNTLARSHQQLGR